VGRKLMVALERVAKGEGRTLITLDTRRGDAAEPLYRGLGYEVAGIIPRYARAPEAERLDDTIYMFKELS
jgi:ribosomal protein S18 acetylase RimI-like enzyme